MPTPDQIIQAVAVIKGTCIPDIKKGSRRFAKARQIAMLLMRSELSMKLESIGAALGGLDHSTVWHGVNVAADLTANDETFAAEVESVRMVARQIASGQIIKIPTPDDVALDAAFDRLNRRLRRTKRIRSCLNVIAFRAKDAPKRKLTRYSLEWYAENNDRYCAAVSIAHPERICWSWSGGVAVAAE